MVVGWVVGLIVGGWRFGFYNGVGWVGCEGFITCFLGIRFFEGLMGFGVGLLSCFLSGFLLGLFIGNYCFL